MNWIGGSRKRILEQKKFTGGFIIHTRKSIQQQQRQRQDQGQQSQDLGDIFGETGRNAANVGRRLPYSDYDVAGDPNYRRVVKPNDEEQIRTLPILDLAKDKLPNGHLLALQLSFQLELGKMRRDKNSPHPSSSIRTNMTTTTTIGDYLTGTDRTTTTTTASSRSSTNTGVPRMFGSQSSSQMSIDGYPNGREDDYDDISIKIKATPDRLIAGSSAVSQTSGLSSISRMFPGIGANSVISNFSPRLELSSDSDDEDDIEMIDV